MSYCAQKIEKTLLKNLYKNLVFRKMLNQNEKST